MAKKFNCPCCGAELELTYDKENKVITVQPVPEPTKNDDDIIAELLGDGKDKKPE